MIKKFWTGLGLALILTVNGCGNTEKQPINVDPITVEADLVLRIGVSTNREDYRSKAAQFFADEILKKTGGRVGAQLFPDGQLGADDELIRSLAENTGTVDIIITDASNFTKYEPKMGISALPFQFQDFDQAWAFMDSSIEATVEKSLLDHNMRVLAHYCNGFRCMTNNVRPVTVPLDLAGLNIRTPDNPVIIATMKAIGAKPKTLGFNKVYDALKRGEFDGQENPIPVIYNNKLYEVQKYLSVTNHIYSGMCFTISEEVWKKLTTEQQQILQEAALASAEMDRRMNREQTENLVDALAEKGMEVNYPDLESFQQATIPVLTDNLQTYGDLIDRLSDWKKLYNSGE